MGAVVVNASNDGKMSMMLTLAPRYMYLMWENRMRFAFDCPLAPTRCTQKKKVHIIRAICIANYMQAVSRADTTNQLQQCAQFMRQPITRAEAACTLTHTEDEDFIAPPQIQLQLLPCADVCVKLIYLHVYEQARARLH